MIGKRIHFTAFEQLAAVNASWPLWCASVVIIDTDDCGNACTVPKAVYLTANYS